MTSQPGREAIVIHILPYISRRKDNQIMKFGYLIEYTFFLKNHLQNVVEKLVPDPNLKLNISLCQ